MNKKTVACSLLCALSVAMLAAALAGAFGPHPFALSPEATLILTVVIGVGSLLLFICGSVRDSHTDQMGPTLVMWGFSFLGFGVVLIATPGSGGLIPVSFGIGIFLLLWRGERAFFDSSIFRCVLQKGINLVPNAQAYSPARRFRKAERMYRRAAIKGGVTRLGDPLYLTRDSEDHRYGPDGMPQPEVKRVLAVIDKARDYSICGLAILVRTVPGQVDQPAVIFVSYSHLQEVTSTDGGLQAMSCTIPLQDIAGMVFFAWHGSGG